MRLDGISVHPAAYYSSLSYISAILSVSDGHGQVSGWHSDDEQSLLLYVAVAIPNNI